MIESRPILDDAVDIRVTPMPDRRKRTRAGWSRAAGDIVHGLRRAVLPPRDSAVGERGRPAATLRRA
jgi:hypothetical protein